MPCTVNHLHLNLKTIFLNVASRRGLSQTTVNSQQTVMNVFDRNSKKLQRERSLSSVDVATYDYLKDEIGSRLADRLLDISRKFENAVDLGCSRGHVSKHILSDCVTNLIMCDSSHIALEQAAVPEPGINVIKKIVDEEHLTFESNSIDLFISSLSLHWVNNLPYTFQRVIESLKPDGAFLGAVFGGDTLYELRSSLQLAETERSGGVSAHVSPFTEVSDIGRLLNSSGFTLLTIDTDEIVIGYPSMFELMWDLKGMGENNSSWRRSTHLRKDVILSAASIYQELYGSQEKIPATFQVIFFVGWKPAPSQPKPARRGSQTHSFGDLQDVVIKPPGKK